MEGFPLSKRDCKINKKIKKAKDVWGHFMLIVQISKKED